MKLIGYLGMAAVAVACSSGNSVKSEQQQVANPPSNPNWPLLSYDCAVTECVMPDQTPGLRVDCPGGEVRDGDVVVGRNTNGCVNPCPTGRAPDEGQTYCMRLCRQDADCPLDSFGAHMTCEARGTCAVMEDPGTCPTEAVPGFPGETTELTEECVANDGSEGFRCADSTRCVRACPPGLKLTGGTHCAKWCTTDADCPGDYGDNSGCVKEEGESEGICGGLLCPSEGCPYPWGA